MSGLGLELTEMVSLMGRQQDLITSLGEKGAHLDERKETLSKEVEDLRHNLSAVSLELTKANDIIKKLQDETGHLSRTVKTQENILSSQDAQLKAKEERIIQTGTALNGATERIAKLEELINIANISQLESNERVKNLEECLVTKESMITYLTKQIIDSESGSKKMIEEIEVLRDSNFKLEAELEGMKSGHDSLNERLKIAEESVTVKENMITALTKKIDDSEGLSKLMSHEIQILRKNNGKLDSDYHEKQRALGNLLGRVNEMEAELKDKTALISRQQELISNLGEKGAFLESRKDILERESDDLKMNLREVSIELGKANEIIRKLQQDGRNLTRQVKTQETVLNSLENQLKTKTEGLNKSSSALKSATDKLAKLENELEGLNRVRSELESRSKTSEEAVLEKENMITYLSKKLNDYEGLANLDKFRQTLSLSTNQQLDTTNGRHNTTAPPRMHMFNSTLGLSQSNPLFISDLRNKNGEGDEPKKKNPVSTVRTPAWAKSNKATLDNLLSKAPAKKLPNTR